MLLDRTCPLSELQHLESCKTESISLRLDDVADLCAGAVLGKDHFNFLAAEFPCNDRSEPEFKRRLENDPLVRRRRPLHDRLAQSPCTIDHNGVTESALR